VSKVARFALAAPGLSAGCGAPVGVCCPFPGSFWPVGIGCSFSWIFLACGQRLFLFLDPPPVRLGMHPRAKLSACSADNCVASTGSQVSAHTGMHTLKHSCTHVSVLAAKHLPYQCPPIHTPKHTRTHGRTHICTHTYTNFPPTLYTLTHTHT